VPGEVAFQIVQAGVAERGVELLDEIGRAHVEALDGRDADFRQVCFPAEVGRERHQFVHRQAMVGVVGISARDAIHGRGIRSVAALGGCEQFEHFLDVLLVLCAQGDRARIVPEIVVAIGKAEAALIDVGDLLFGVLGVGAHAEAEERANAVLVEADDFGGQVLLGVDLRDAGEQRRDGLDALGFDGGLVEARGIEVADSLLERGAFGVRGGEFFQDVVLDAEVVLAELVEAAPAGAVGRDGIVFAPDAARILVEVLAGVDGGAHGFEVEAGGGGGVGGTEERGGERGENESRQRPAKQEHI
jgi:hypothetical protein